MLTRVFHFTPDQKGRTDFRVAYEAFRARDPQKTKDDRRQLAELQRAFEAISDPIGDLPEDADLDLRFRTLHEDGGQVRLSQPAFKRLEESVEQCAFQSGVSAQVTDFLDRWSASETVESDGPVAIAPRRKRA